MGKIGYRNLIMSYVEELDPDDMILTTHVTDYVIKKTGLLEDDVRKRVNVNLARLEKADYIARINKGVYCKKIKTPFGYYVPNKEILFCRQLIKDENHVIGYETGLSVLNQIGLVSQMPKKRYIATNRHIRRVPEGIQVEIRKPPIMVTAENYRYLQILDVIDELDEAPIDTPKPTAVVRKVAKELDLDTDQLILMARKHYKTKTLMKTIDILLENANETI